MTTDSQKTLNFPIDQRESANQKRANTLLAADVYARLHGFVKEAKLSSEDDKSDPGSQRQHRAVLIDGARGTGKSSVLLNLGLYLADVDKDLFNDVHICKPIDPTLLEDHDNLFLNVIVAAVLSDKTVMDAQNQQPDKRAALHKQLQRLGSALEGLQKQRDQEGLDKLRSFIGNNQLIGEVDRFFREVCSLLGKKLLILTIDDVDTSLNQAFENLEVVRRYLVSPVVLPIISGDQRLYNEVTWREFHGKLLKDSSYARADAALQAKELAKEYQRKILPLQYRLQMPDVAQYLRDQNILLTHETARMSPLSLPFFKAWVESILNGAVNGVENSYLALPLKTVRSLAQLVYRVKDLLPELARDIAEKHLDEMGVKRALLLSKGVDAALRNSENFANNAFRKEYLKKFISELPELYGRQAEPENAFISHKMKWRHNLYEQFKSDAEAGTAFLVLQAQADWFGPSLGQRPSHLFDTPLFQPLHHGQESLRHFAASVDLSDWQLSLVGRVPEGWLARLPSHAILPYPIPEAGRAITSAKSKNRYRFSDGEDRFKNNLLVDLMLHRDFYSSNKKSVLICVGRIVELIFTSFLRKINANDLGALLRRPPFYSIGNIAATKTLTISEDDIKPDDDWPEDNKDEMLERNLAILQLVREINEWEEKYQVTCIEVSPWLIYNVFNKVMNQAWFFNQPMGAGGQDRGQNEQTVARAARKTFYSIWSAFGSFEKGSIYGLQPVISTINIGDGEKFENSALYRQNISPFYSESDADIRSFGEKTRSISFLLGEHPLRKWVEQTPRPKQMEIIRDVFAAREILANRMNVTVSTIETATIDSFRRMIKKRKMNHTQASELYQDLIQNFPGAKTSLSVFLKVIEDFDTPPTTHAE